VTICLVTDRRCLVPAGASDDAAVRCLVAQARHAVDAGIDLIQIRERDLEAAALAAIVRAVLAVTRGSPTRVVVNDRADVAIACGADGVHLRSDSIAPAAVRAIAPASFTIGRSVHGAADVPGSRGADYLIAGTVFRSASKPPDRALLGEAGLRAIASAADVPVLAIGGVTVHRAAQVAAAGASGVAAIGLFMRGSDASEVACRACTLADIVAHTRTSFGRVKSGA
jgi:thiamine-phosphate pyrophosphorylase